MIIELKRHKEKALPMSAAKPKPVKHIGTYLDVKFYIEEKEMGGKIHYIPVVSQKRYPIVESMTEAKEAVAAAIELKDTNAKIFEGITTKEERTEAFQNWLINSPDEVRKMYANNWRIPHTLFNVSCRYFRGDDIQNIDFSKIYKAKNLGCWNKNGEKIRV